MSLASVYTSIHFILMALLWPRVSIEGISMVPASIVHSYTPQNPYEAHLVGLFAATSELPLKFEAIKPALDLAVEDVRKKFPVIRIHLSMRRDERTCEKNYAASYAAEEYYKNKFSGVHRAKSNVSASQSYGLLEQHDLRPVNAFIGPACSKALDFVARLAAYWNVPIFTAGGIGVEFANKKLYSTLTRLSFSLDRVSHFVIKILNEFQWHHISLIVDETFTGNRLLRKSLEEVIRNQSASYNIKLDVQTFSLLNEDGEMTNRTIDYKKILKAASRNARVIMFAIPGESVRDVLLDAYDLGMGNGEYAFLAIELIKSSSGSSQEAHGWYRIGDRRNKEAREIFESLLQIAVRVPTSIRFTSFVHEVVKRAQNEFSTAIKASDVNPVIAAFYDAVQVFAWGLNETLARGLDPSDGRSFMKIFWNRTFIDGITGDIMIDENGDREADYTMNDLDPETGFMIPVATYFGARRVYEKLSGYEITWSGGQTRAPLDIPKCGFLGDALECRKPAGFPLASVLSVSLVTCVAIVSTVAFFIIRKVRLETELNDSWWRVNWDEIRFAEKSTIKKSTTSIGTSQATLSSATGVTTKISGATSVASSMNTTCANISGVLVGMYKGVKVAVKELGVSKIHVNRELLMDIKLMREFTHDNLVRFIGLCTEEPNFAVVTELATRGSLTDMLENENVKIDWIFKYSIISDIVEGMAYLHTTAHGYHGTLKSSNCVIDSRFTVKIINYGLKKLEDQRVFKYDAEESFNPRNLFWTAPEHLRTRSPLRSGSPKGDVYSFAIILQEIITRCGPFESIERAGRKKGQLNPEEILDRLKMGTIPPFRPEVAPDEAPPELIDLMHACWAEDPSLRPDFSTIKPRLRKITKGVTSKNFLDNLLNRMEQYANNLEKIVEEKTDQMMEEKRKTEEILYQLLPKPIAEELKKGSPIQPESYESVTIFFSDIEGFTSLSAESTPLQVVDLLNDLYTCFDAIIDHYDVFKVETIGDAYMVASGLPLRNGTQHAREIARMALDVRDAMVAFKIRHKPDRKLRVRIGVHTGPAVGGVVGTKMPKYIIFGETVIIASKMESTGEPLKVHISSECKNVLESNFPTFKISLRGQTDLKGSGQATTYWLDGEERPDKHESRDAKSKSKSSTSSTTSSKPSNPGENIRTAGGSRK